MPEGRDTALPAPNLRQESFFSLRKTSLALLPDSRQGTGTRASAEVRSEPEWLGEGSLDETVSG